MPTKFVDHGLYPAYALAAAVGVAYEGDGLAQGLAAPASVSINLNGYTAAATNTFSVAGATLTAVASGAGVNQFNAGAGATLATNLATAINAATNPIVVNPSQSNPILGWRAAQLRDVVYASASGTTLTIQTRAGSALYNGTSFFAVVSGGLTGGAAINATFSGGASGAWGYLLNNSALWPSANAIASYGLIATNQPIAGVLAAGDVVKVRSNKILTLPANTNYTWTTPAMGSATAPVVLEFDDSTTWSDGVDPVFKISQSHVANTAMLWLSHNLAYLVVRAKQYASGQRSFVLEVPPTIGPSLPNIIVGGGGSPIRFENIDFSTPGNASTSSSSSQIRVITGGSMSQVATQFFNCRFQWPRQNNNSTGYINPNSANGQARLRLVRCEFGQTEATLAQANVMNFFSGSSAMRLDVEECKFTGILSTSRLLPTSNLNQGSTCTFKNCDFGGIKVRGPNFSSMVNSLGTAEAITSFTKYGSRDFFLDTRAGFVEWNAAQGYPTLSAKLLDGVTGWVMFVIPTTIPTNISKFAPLELPPINKYNSLATGARTATVNLAIESTLSWTTADVSVMISYLDSTGGIRVVDTFDPIGATLSDDPTSLWSSESNGMVTFAGQSFAKKKFSVALPDCAFGCEITATVRVHAPVANETLGLFVDPEIKVV